MYNYLVVNKKAWIKVMKGYVSRLLSFKVNGIRKLKTTRSILFLFALVLLMLPMESFARGVSSEPCADQRIYIYDQGWGGAHKHGGNIQIYHKGKWKPLNESGCGFYVYLHAYQWLTGNTVSTSNAESLILKMKDEISKLAGKTEWDCREDKYYENYFKSFGIKRSNPSMKTESLVAHFAAGGVVKAYTPEGGKHYNLAVGIAYGDIDNNGESEYWVHIVDSSAYSTLSEVEKAGFKNHCYSFTNHSALSYSKLRPSNPKITNKRSEDNGVALEYWIRFDAYAQFKIVAGYLPGNKSNPSTTLEFQNVTCPTNYKIGSSGGYPLSGGTLVSNEELKTITSTIKKSDGTVISGPKTRNLSGKSYSIISLDTYEKEDNGVKFSKITKEGNYVWILTATDASGKTLTLEMPFTASSNATSSKDVSIKYPDVVGVEINEQNFPDANFRSYISVVDKDKNGKLNDEEIMGVKTLYVNDKGIQSLNGIEYFTELTLLRCYSNNISSLNLSALTKLVELDCGDNPISNLDVSKNTALQTLICGNTYLQTLDLSKNASLTKLVCEQYCYGWNELTSIDVSNCPVLNSLVKEQTYGDSIIKGHPYLYNHWLHGWATKNSDETLDKYLFVGPDVEVTTDAGIYVSDKKKPDSKEDKLRAYVTRCYEIILGREPDAGGMKTWYNELVSGRKAASEIIDNFVRSQEFLGKKYSNADAVEILYKAMLGRGSDPAGKADWVGKLDAGHPFAVVINGFCGSKEFKEICDSYGIAPGSVSMEQGSASDQQIRAFVTRCYNIILGRGADEVGMNTWFSELKSRRRTAAEIIEQFVYSQEFQNKKYSNPDAVEILYKAMLGRGSDPAGKADWVGRLAGGQPLTAIINGFCGSMEFTAICEAYGITPGSVQVQSLNHQTEIQEEPVVKQTVTKTENNVTKVEIVNPSDTENEQLGTAVQAIYVNEEKAKEFIGRCYRCILGREASQTELDGWIGQMLNGTKTADQIARGFLFSGEFKDKNVSNEELVKILYRVYLNRDADAEGLETWTQKLDEGTSLQVLLDTFAKTNEFIAVVKNMAQ